MLIFIIFMLKLVQIGIEMIPNKMAASCLLQGHSSILQYFLHFVLWNTRFGEYLDVEKN